MSQADSSTVPSGDPTMEVDEEVSLAPPRSEHSIPSTIVLDPSIARDTATSAVSSSDATWIPMRTLSTQGGTAGSLMQSSTQQSDATSRELAEVREELSRLRTVADQAILSTSQQQQAASHHVQNRVDATVAHFETMGAETSARAQHAQNVATEAHSHGAEALRRTVETSEQARQAQSVASEAHSHGTEALRRTEMLMKKQTEEMDTLRQQMNSMRKLQEDSQGMVKQLQEVLVTAQD